MKDIIRRLPDAEQEVMQAIWACTSPVARTDIEEILFKTHPMAMTTLLTLLTRLSEKALLRLKRMGAGVTIPRAFPRKIILHLKARISLKSSVVEIYRSLRTLFVIAV